jgi:methanogenic corrinoid protein MtbC1
LKKVPEILCLSSLLTTSALEVSNVIEFLGRSGLRDALKIIIGGADVNEDLARKSGVDGYARTAVEGLNICKEWLKKKELF